VPAEAVVLFLSFGRPRCSGFLIDGFSCRCTFTVADSAMSEEGLPVPSCLFPALPPKEGAKLGADNDSYRFSVAIIRAAGERETFPFITS